jgi:prevent-host-death family protein
LESPRRGAGAAGKQGSIRTIFSSHWEQRQSEDGDLLIYRVRGNGFLHHMVRNLVGHHARRRPRPSGHRENPIHPRRPLPLRRRTHRARAGTVPAFGGIRRAEPCRRPNKDLFRPNLYIQTIKGPGRPNALSTQIKPISYVKAHAAELLDRITEEREPIIITQNGEARAVLMDVASYDDMMQETETLIKILAHADKEIEAGDTVPIEEIMEEFGVECPKA